jgi:hypothetical protein
VVEQKHSIGLFFAFIYTLVRIIVRRLAKLNSPFFQASPKIMTLIRLVQRASILAGMTFAGLPFQSNPARAEITEFCIIASNGKTLCGKPRGIERMCITTDGSNTVCGKFKSAKEGQEQEQQAKQPIQGNGSRIVVNNVAFLSKSCSRSDTTVKCSLSMRNKGTEVDFWMSASYAAITDSSGKTYKASNLEVGGQSGSAICSIKLTPEVDYEAVLTFDGIPGGVTKAQLLSFPFAGKTVA